MIGKTYLERGNPAAVTKRPGPTVAAGATSPAGPPECALPSLSRPAPFPPNVTANVTAKVRPTRIESSKTAGHRAKRHLIDKQPIANPAGQTPPTLFSVSGYEMTATESHDDHDRIAIVLDRLTLSQVI